MEEFSKTDNVEVAGSPAAVAEAEGMLNERMQACICLRCTRQLHAVARANVHRVHRRQGHHHHAPSMQACQGSVLWGGGHSLC